MRNVHFHYIFRSHTSPVEILADLKKNKDIYNAVFLCGILWEIEWCILSKFPAWAKKVEVDNDNYYKLGRILA